MFILLVDIFFIFLSASAIDYNPENATISSTLDALKSGISCAEIVSAYIQRIQKYDAEIGALITLNPDALSQAKKLDENFKAKGSLLPLQCATVIVKDVIDVEGLPTTCGVNLFLPNVASEDADVTVFLRIHS